MFVARRALFHAGVARAGEADRIRFPWVTKDDGGSVWRVASETRVADIPESLSSGGSGICIEASGSVWTVASETRASSGTESFRSLIPAPLPKLGLPTHFHS